MNFDGRAKETAYRIQCVAVTLGRTESDRLAIYLASVTGPMSTNRS